MKLIAIAVVGRNRVIGDGEDQPFKFAEDWARFKRVTTGHPLIMGRKTHDAMGLLPGRASIVLTRQPDKLDFPVGVDGQPRGYAVASLEEAIEVASRLDGEVGFVIGGGQVYALAWDRLDELDLTEVHDEAPGSVVLPKVDPEEWVEVSRRAKGPFDFVRYERRQLK